MSGLQHTDLLRLIEQTVSASPQKPENEHPNISTETLAKPTDHEDIKSSDADKIMTQSSEADKESDISSAGLKHQDLDNRHLDKTEISKDSNAFSANDSDSKQNECFTKEIGRLADIGKGDTTGEVRTSESVVHVEGSAVNEMTKTELSERLTECQGELEATKKKLVKAEWQLEKANDYNEILRNMVEKLSSEIHRHKHAKTRHMHIQVDSRDLLKYTEGEPVMPCWEEDNMAAVSMEINTISTEDEVNNIVETQSDPMLSVSEGFSIADSVRAAAEAVVTKQTRETLMMSGYVYHEESGLYYHPESGYYFDSEKSLYYEPNSGTYYYYDYDTGQYEFHSQVDISAHTVHGEQLPQQQVDTGPGDTVLSDTFRRTSSPVKSTVKVKKKKTPKVIGNRKERRQAMKEKEERKRQKKIA